MERPNKKPRVGPSPFQHINDDDDDLDANGDELNVAPEKINALRDPGYQLQKGRAFAAFKLKSAFERIFEKYGRDFTGVGDEIDLSTGKIVVNNGHVESLKRSAVGGGDEEDDDEDDDQDEDDDVGDENEDHDIGLEHELLNGADGGSHGNAEDDGVLLSQLGLSPPSPVATAADPVDIRGPWPGAVRHLGGPPLLSSLISPAHVHLTSMPMAVPLPLPYGGFDPVQSWVEPAWRIPELPSPAVGNMTGSPVTRIVPRSRASMLLMAAENGGGEDEDDILFGSSTVDLSTPRSDRPIKTKKLSSPLILVGSGSVCKKNRQATPSSVTKRSRNETLKKSKGVARKTPLKERKSANRSSNALPGEMQTPTNTVQLDSETIVVKGSDTGRDTTTNLDAQPKPPKRRSISSQINEHSLTETKHVDVYINYSSPSRTLAIKPSNQRLQVEILVQRSVDIGSFQVTAPEPADTDMTDHEPYVESEVAVQHTQDSHGPIDIEIANHSIEISPEVDEAQHVHSPHDLDKTANGTPERDPPSRPVTVEVFSRNIVDPAYDFSDEDEPTIPTAREKPLRSGRQENKTFRVQGEELTRTPEISSTEEPTSQAEPLGALAPQPHEMDTALDSYLEAKTPESFTVPDERNEAMMRSPGERSSLTTGQWEEINVASLLSSAEKTKARRMILSDKPSEADTSQAVTESPPAQAPTQTESPFVAPTAYLADKPRRKLKQATPEVKPSPPAGGELPPIQSPTPLQEEQSITQTSPGAEIEAGPATSYPPLEESTPNHALQPTEPSLTPIWDGEPTSQQITKRLLSSKPRRSKSLFAVSTNTQEPTEQQADIPTTDEPHIETPAPITPISKRHGQSLHWHPASTDSDRLPSSVRSQTLSILSLVSDDDKDEDELSLTPRHKRVTPIASTSVNSNSNKHRESVSARSILRGSGPRRPSASSLNMNRQATPSLLGASRTPTSARHPASTPLARRVSSSALRSPGSSNSDTRRRRSQLVQLRRPGRQVSPMYPGAEELARTPGGTMRRCGENGFRCDRDFCFVCL
ncbi:hypothetical protein B0T19DRAFT_409316 [Cercophora scortea]|uniref:Myb-like DNA-binding domain protein n=1 Tax=Cercophora scortea TaxID=314031 RepID=A0AAE0J3S3_9PEZI|nr:hypothetical protein B0T19DRAFT_409316 [Cercophora scortea]